MQTPKTTPSALALGHRLVYRLRVKRHADLAS